MTGSILPPEPGRLHNILVLRLANKHDVPLLRAHLAVRRVALGLTPDRYTPLVHAELHALAQETVQRASQLVTEFMRVMTPRLRAMCEAVGQAAAALRSAGLITEDGHPARAHASRPAWMSPYGPPSRRR